MLLHTTHLGDIEYSDSDVIHFPVGIPGFDDQDAYIIVPSYDLEFPFSTLQSVKNTELAFIVTDPFLFVENYDFDIDDADALLLNIKTDNDLENVIALTIVTIPENVEDTTINIMAPIIINNDKKLAKQVLLYEYNDVKYTIFKKTSEE